MLTIGIIIALAIGWVTHPVLTVLAAVIVWAARAYFAPFAACGRCRGKKVNWFTRRFALKKRHGLCKRCKGSGTRQVLGSKQVHKFVRSARSSWSARSGKD